MTDEELRGTDHLVQAAGDGLLVRTRQGSEGLDVAREAGLLRLLRDLVPLPVPRVVAVDAENQSMTMQRMPGVPLTHVTPISQRNRVLLGADLGRLIAALCRVPAKLVANLVPIDPAGPSAYAEHVAEIVGAHYELIPSRHRQAVADFAKQAPPDAPKASMLRTAHNDLGAEHIFIQAGPTGFRITGIIDWSDAALADIALDLGLILRDLGPDAFRVARDLAGTAWGPDPALDARALFYARARSLEDLAFGVQQDEERYIRGAMSAFGRLFTMR